MLDVMADMFRGLAFWNATRASEDVGSDARSPAKSKRRHGTAFSECLQLVPMGNKLGVQEGLGKHSGHLPGQDAFSLVGGGPRLHARQRG